MKRQATDCDLCGERDVVSLHLYFHTGHQVGVDGSEPSGPHYDVCEDCQREVLAALVKWLNKCDVKTVEMVVAECVTPYIEVKDQPF